MPAAATDCKLQIENRKLQITKRFIAFWSLIGLGLGLLIGNRCFGPVDWQALGRLDVSFSPHVGK